MRVGGAIWRGCGLTHRPYAQLRYLVTEVRSTSTRPQQKLRAQLRNMGSVSEPPPEWSAERVRQTFLDYFKKNGHTFGGSHTIWESEISTDFVFQYPRLPLSLLQILLCYSQMLA